MLRGVTFLAAFLMLVAAVEGQRRVCEPGSVFMVQCNTCRCSQDGTEMGCTRKECPLEHLEEFPSRQRVCRPGSFFKMDCNDCKCNDDGTDAACTLKACF